MMETLKKVAKYFILPLLLLYALWENVYERWRMAKAILADNKRKEKFNETDAKIADAKDAATDAVSEFERWKQEHRIRTGEDDA